MPIVKQYNKATDTTYVYEATNYYNSEKKRMCQHRKLIGKIDPTTGQMVKTGKRGRPPKVNILPVNQEGKHQDLSTSDISDKKENEIKEQFIELYKKMINVNSEVKALKDTVSSLVHTLDKIVEETNINL